MNRKNVLWAFAGALTVCLAGCNFFNLFHVKAGPEKDREHIEREKQTADAGVDVTRDIAQNGVEPGGRNAIVANALATDLSRSLGTPQQKIDYMNDAEVKFLRGENQRKDTEYKAKQKAFEDKIASLTSTAVDMTVGGGIGGTLLVGALGWFWRNKRKISAAKDEIEQFAKAQVVGTSQLKATYDQARLEIMQIAKTDPAKALEAALNMLHRDAINPILRNGAEAVGGSKSLESMLTHFKDGIEQNLLNRPLLDPKIMIHG